MELSKDRKRELLLRPLKMGIILRNGGLLSEGSLKALAAVTLDQLQEEGIEPSEVEGDHRHLGGLDHPAPRADRG